MRRGCGHGADGRQLRDRRVVEDVARRQADSRLRRARDDLQREDRVATELEEAVVNAHAADAQDAAPDVRELLLHRRARRLERLIELGTLCTGHRQRRTVHLAAGQVRQFVEEDEERRHHVIREGTREEAPELARARRLALRHHVAHEALHAGVVAAHHCDSFANGRVEGDPAFNLAELDAIAADLDLVIETADVLDLAVRKHARRIARPVQPRARARRQRIGNETVGGEGAAIQIAAADLHAADVQLACDADRRRVQVAIEHVHLGIGNRPSDGHAAAVVVGQTARVVRDVNGSLCRSVQVVELRRQRFQASARERTGQRLSTANHACQRPSVSCCRSPG